MRNIDGRRLWILPGFFLGCWFLLRFAVPFVLPFGIGWALAALVQPQIRFLTGKLHLPRKAASAISVTGGLVLLGVTAAGIFGLLCREAAVLARGIPDAVETLSERAELWQQWALGLAARMPPVWKEPLGRGIKELFTGGSVLVEKAAGLLLALAGKAVGGISGGAFAAATAVLASFLISVQYPVLRKKVEESGLWRDKIRPVLGRLREVFGSWLRAQLRLSGITFGIVTGGFLLLRVEQPILWAALTAVVDAVPMLGTGAVLVPMALLSFLWGNRVRTLGLLGIYTAAAVTRSMLEPKLIGKQLGLNPLLTLFAIYAGYRLWGIGGMILSPMLTVLAFRLAAKGCE